MITPLPEKLNTLYSFLRSNVHAKILVFLSSGKQVRFVYESFRRLRPGISLLHLHGRQKQTARLDITSKFSTAKYSCLFATDVVARGIDFPAVDWVLQLDCPEDAETYIHRVGRTARYERDGRAVLFLDPSEESGMIRRFEQKRIPIERINVRQKKQQNITDQLQNMCFKDPELKYLGQKAFMSYVRSIYLQQDKEVFQLANLPLEDFSASLGLPGAPKIKFWKGDDPKALKNASRQRIVSSDEEDDDVEGEVNGVRPEKKQKSNGGGVRTRYDRMFERRNQDVLAPHYSKIVHDDDEPANHVADADEDDQFLTVKRRIEHANGGSTINGSSEKDDLSNHSRKVIPAVGREPLVIDSKRREKLLLSKKKLLKLKGRGTKLVYDDQGDAHPVYELEDEDQFRQRGDPESQRLRFVEDERHRVVVADISDKQVVKAKRRGKKDKRKAREAEIREEEKSDGDGDFHVELAPYDGDDGYETRAVNGKRRSSFHHDVEGEDDGEQKQEEERLSKRPRKWFERDDELHDGRRTTKKGHGRSLEAMDGPQSLEDLEMLAQGLLG